MPIDSNQKQLSIPEVIVAAMQEQGVSKRMVGPYILSILKESSMPNTDVRTFGNTAFITHIKEKEGMKAAFGRPLNADTARNYLKNVEEYIKSLVDQSVSHFITYYKDPRIDTVIKYIKLPKVQKRIGAELDVKTKKTNSNTVVGVIVRKRNAERS